MSSTPVAPPSDGGSGLPVAPQPTQQAPAPASSTPASGAPTGGPAPAPSGPATAPASALPPSTSSGVHGVLAHIALGALSGAATALKKTGNVVRNYEMNTPQGQEIQKTRLAQQEGQQRMQLAQKASQREDTAAMDDHQIKQLTLQDMNMDHLHKIAENAHQSEVWNDEERKMHQAQDQEDRATAATLESMGVHLTPKPMSEFTPTDAQAVGPHPEGQGGQQLLFSNGKTGKESGGYFGSNAELEATILPHDVKVIDDWTQDPKTGDLKPVYKTMAGGTNTAWDFVVAQDAGMEKFNVLQKQYKDKLDDQKTKAAIAESQGKTVQEYADAEKAKAEAKQALMGAGLGNPSLKGDAFLASLPPMQKNIVGGLLRYQVKPTDLGRSKDRVAMLGATIQADPNEGKPNEWSEAQYAQRYDYLQEYGSSTKGDGATRSRINTAVGHLDLLKQAGDALAQNNIPKINEIANMLGTATGQSPQMVYDAIAEKAGGEIAGAVKGGGASATDPALEKASQHLTSNMSPQQRQDVLAAQAAILQTMVGTIAGKFQENMKATPDEFGQPVLYGGNAERLKGILTGGPGGAMTPPPNATGMAPDPKTGVQYWHDANGKPIAKVQGQ